MHGGGQEYQALAKCCHDLTQLVREGAGKNVEQETRTKARDFVFAATSALEQLSSVIKADDPVLDDDIRRSVYELLKTSRAAIVASTISPILAQQVDQASHAVAIHLSKLATKSRHAAYPASPRAPAVPSPSSPEPPSLSSPRQAVQPISPTMVPVLPRLPLSPIHSPRSGPLSPSSARRGEPFIWEEEDQVTCLRAIEGVRKTMHVLELLGSPNPRAHSKEIVETTREGLSDLTFVRNKAEGLGLTLPAATLKACLVQLTELIRQTLVGTYQVDEGKRIGKDLALSVRAIMFSRHFTVPGCSVTTPTSPPMSPAPSMSQLNALVAIDEPTQGSPYHNDKGKEKVRDEDEDIRADVKPQQISSDPPRSVTEPPSVKIDTDWLKESFRALESAKMRRKAQFSSEMESQEEEPEKPRVRSICVGKPAVCKSDRTEDPLSNDCTDSASKRLQAAIGSGRNTVNIGAIDVKKHGSSLRSSHSMPDRMKDQLKTSPSSFPNPVTSASDERAVGRRMTVRKPVLLTGYLDSTSFVIGSTISFRLIINNMHKRQVKGVEMKLYKHTASFSYKQEKGTGQTLRKVGSKHQVKVAKQRKRPEGFPVLQTKQWTGVVQFDLPSSLPPSVIADADATYEIAYTAKIKLQPKSCAIVLGPFALVEA